MALRLLWILLLALCNTPLSARQNYIQYHKDIIGAERLFLANKFDSSLKVYKKIFTEYPKPFAKDCFTALQIACIANDTTKAKYFFDLCFKRGIGWNTMMAVGCIKDMLSQDNMRRYAKESLVRGHKQYYASLDTNLRNKLLAMLARDQGSRNYLSGPNRLESLHVKILDTNIIELKKICEKYGYPGESLAGIDDDSPNKEGNYVLRIRMSSLPAIIFFHHQHGFPLMKEYLLKAIADGELQPREYGLIYEWSYASIATKQSVEANKQKYPNLEKQYGSSVFKYQVTAEHPPRDKFYNLEKQYTYYCHDTLLVNNDRAEIGISTLQHDAAKQFFAKKHNLVLFYGLFARY